MPLVWCPETASKAYVDVVKALANRGLRETNVAEYVAAMAGGRRVQLIVEAWAPDDCVATSIGLLAAAGHAQGRYVCAVPDEESATEYVEAIRRAGVSVDVAETVVVGDVEEAMRELEGVDLMVVDCRRTDTGKLLRAARPGPRGMVVVCKGASTRRGGAPALKAAGRTVDRLTFLPIGSGVEVLHVDVGKESSFGGGEEGRARWIRHVDRATKEEHVFRR